jgi:hypothetical protein
VKQRKNFNGAVIMTTSVRVGGVIFLLISILVIWYSVASDYSYDAVSGTYAFASNGEKSTLVLRKDLIFQQQLSRAGK